MTPSPPDEREAIVRWLRLYAALPDVGKTSTKYWKLAKQLHSLIADAIERGEHLVHLSEQGEG